MKTLHIFTVLITPQIFFTEQFNFLTENGQDIWVASNSFGDFCFSKTSNTIYRQIPIKRRIAPLADLKSIYRIIKLIRKEKFDIVVGHTPKGAMVAMIAARIAGVKTRIYYRHGLIYTTASGLKKIILQTVERLTAYCATNIINVSHSLATLALKDHLNSAAKQTIIGAGTCGGIDTINLFNPANTPAEKISLLHKSLGIQKDDLVIGFCGRLCRDKGIIELVNGFRLFQAHSPATPAKLLLVGPYDERDVLPGEIKKILTTDENIICTGMIEKEHLPVYYAAMDIFVFPSYREGFGMSVIEASAMQLPILVSHSHGCEDSIIEHVTGEYINIDAHDICRGITNMTNSEARLKYGTNGRKWVTENFERTHLWPLISDYYHNLYRK